MKIEKISDSQIRCTLNHSDLNARSLSLKELAYGTSRARELFHEMIRQAGEEVGFQAEDMPLMIEAIPLAGDGIILNITKIEDPEELDTRFARFAPGIENPDPEDTSSAARGVTADLLESLRSILSDTEEPDTDRKADPKIGPAVPPPADPLQQKPPAAVYCFRDLDTVIRAAEVLKGLYRGRNTLYRSEQEHVFYLVLHRTSHTPEEYNRICNILTEYGKKIRTTPATESWYEEHLTVLVKDRALQCLTV